MCCVVLCRAVALLLFRLADVSLFRSGFISGSPLTRLCVHCPSREFGGLRQLPLPETSRRLTRLFHTWFGYWPNPTCRSVGKMCTSRVLVLNLVPHTPFSILLLTHVILPRLWRQRNDVRKLERSILPSGIRSTKTVAKGRLRTI